LANHTIAKQGHPQLRRADENTPCCADSPFLSAKDLATPFLLLHIFGLSKFANPLRSEEVWFWSGL
jgi:hypothetical protein